MEKTAWGFSAFKGSLKIFLSTKINHPATVKTSSYVMDIMKMQNHLDTLLAHYTSNNKLDDVMYVIIITLPGLSERSIRIDQSF